MHLQSLELLGFKSFADKTLFEFHEGVTAIVGPNGCGKSNVLDAVRWVLGEQSAKALRGGEMADVIFNGTETRKPLGFAEVSLTFSNNEGELGIDWNEVRVTRRVYRDGNSDYLLNKTACRLRDIQALFADTGVGRSAYSIMEQGKIDLILSSRPEDRRTVFEDAAGITKYKTQKREALRKLEATEANLLRIGDIIKEVKRQIGSLQRQAGKARRYQTLLTDLQVLDTHHSHHQLEQLNAETEESRQEMARLVESERKAQAKIESGENALAEKRRDLDELDNRIGNARAEVQRLQSDLAALRNRIELNGQRAQELNELIDRHENDIAAAETKRTEQESRIHEADALIAKTLQLLETQETEVEQLTQAMQTARSERGQRQEEIESLQLSISKFENRIVSLQNEVTGIAARRDATAARVTELEQAIAAEKSQVEKATANLARTRATMESKGQLAETQQKNLQHAEKQQQQLQLSLAQAEKEIARVERAIAEKQARLEVLRQMTEEGEGLEAGSQAVLKGLSNPDRIRPAIAGALVTNLNVDRKFIPALEAALGRAMHAVVLHEPALATDIFRDLLETKSGQAALAIPALISHGPEKPISAVPEGALAWAIEKVDAPKDLLPIIQHLLENVAIAPDLATALKLKKDSGHLQFATLNGEFVSAEGIVFGGNAIAANDSLLGRKANLANLAQELDGLNKERHAIVKDRDHAQEQLGTLANKVEEARKKHEVAQRDYSETTLQILSAERAVQDTGLRLGDVQSEKTTLEKQVVIASEKIEQIEKELEAQRKAHTEELNRRKVAHQGHENARKKEEETAEELNELRLAVATERQRHESLVNHRLPMTAREAELADLVAARRSDIETYRNRLARQEKESGEAEVQIRSQMSQLHAAEKMVASLTEGRGARLAMVSEQETSTRTLRNSLNDLRDLRGRQEVRQTQLHLRMENLIEHVLRRYQIDLRAFTMDVFAFQKTLSVQLKRRGPTENGAAAEQPAESAPADASLVTETNGTRSVEQIIADLTRQLDNMGPVNLDAVQEYDELEERYRFLEGQNNDLIAARREVLDVISRINSTTQKLFAETFAQVRVNFREMFKELFDGGRADLALQDENDPLNCGIEIIARPPGKQLQSISLLSGGERTMTAVALLFAIYLVRPSPFCILDEMDAPLDESNINRFIRVLDRFVQQSQFIIITHNKRTIAKANVLYGVTMEERGVSKLVAVKLAEDRGSDGALKQARTQPPLTQSRFSLENAEQEQEQEQGLAVSR